MSDHEFSGEGYGRRWTAIADEMFEREARSSTQQLLADRLCAAEKPNDAIDAVLDAASDCFRHCMLFRVQNDRVTVWGARGWLDQTRSLDVFADSAVSGNPLELLAIHDQYRGDAPMEQAYVSFFERLGLEFPRQISLTPVVVAGRQVAILYGDEGEDGRLRGNEAADRDLANRLSAGLTLVLIKRKIRDH